MGLLRKKSAHQQKNTFPWPKIMGILNVTPNSFSDGGNFFNVHAAVNRGIEMAEEGADIIDIGGESTGPGSVYVPVAEELRRTLLAIARLHKRLRNKKTIISIDTYKAEVAWQAIVSGATMINDVTALRGDPEMARVVAETGVPVVLMYSKDSTPRTTRIKKKYKDVVKTIMEFLDERIRFAVGAGISKNKIIIDPGMGAFVSGEPKYSYEILRRLPEFKKLGCPILLGVSRKSFLPGAVTERDEPTRIANLVAVLNGADIIRVHQISKQLP